MKNLLLIIITASGLIIGCKSGKQVSGFSAIKKNIDTLEILPLGISIKTVDFFNKQLSDPPLESLVKADILTKTNSVLESKYKIVIADSNSISNSQLYNDIEQIGESLEKQKNPLTDVNVPSSFNELRKKSIYRYSLLMIVRAQYCINFPNKNNTVWITPVTSTYMNINLFLIDNSNNNIIYYNKTKSSGNVSFKATVEQITMESLRNIYYK